MNSSPKPNFFIVGAPKSGTTALYSYLSKHPEIFMCRPKEPQFFASDIRGDRRNVNTLSEYLALFHDAQGTVVGEASTCYLGSQCAAGCIKQFCPEARIIVMLRNPIDVMYAEHSERLFDGTEHIVDFAAAVDSRELRYCRFDPFKGQPAVALTYRELTRFSVQVRRFIEVFGRCKVHIIFYDDFAANPALAYANVLSFLDVSPDHECSCDAVHANRRVRSTIIQDALRNPPESLRRIARRLFSPSSRSKAGKYLNRLNLEYVPRPMLNPQLRKRLELEHASEVRQLSRLLDRDLSAWIASCV
jgi:hypothetical protein